MDQVDDTHHKPYVGSAKVEAVRIMAKVAKKYGGKVKAAGGIRSLADAVSMIEAGAYPLKWLLLQPLASFMLLIALERAVELRLWMRAVVCCHILFLSTSYSVFSFHFIRIIGKENRNP